MELKNHAMNAYDDQNADKRLGSCSLDILDLTMEV